MRRAVRLLLLFIASLAWSIQVRAAAWVETTVLSDAVTVQLARDGRATVTHATALRVRGGPLKTWTLQGADRDAEPLPDAYVINTSSDKGSGARKELIVVRGDDESLQIDVADDKGLRQGTYLLQFSYTTDFRVSKMLHAHGGWLELTWVGARFPTGLDGAKATFRIPTAPTPPRAAELESTTSEDQGTPVDSFVSSVRRNAQFDDVELIRAHVAQGEPVLWRIWASPGAFDLNVLPGTDPVAEAPALIAEHPREGLNRLTWVSIAALGALLWITVLTLKLRHYAEDCNAQAVRPRALVSLHPVLRVALSGALLAVCIVTAWMAESPNTAVLFSILAMLLAAQRSPVDVHTLRGPGAWLPLTDSEAFARVQPRLRGRFFDLSVWQGRLSTVAYLSIAASAIYLVSRRSPYDAALLGLLVPVPLPLFVTALSSQLPHARAQRKRVWLSKLQRRLVRNGGIRVVAWARFPDGQAAPDELRLRIIGSANVAGLLGIEVAYTEITQDQLATVTLIIRAKEGSLAQRVWQNRLVWQRGRRPDERVALYDLDWPVLELAVDTIMELLSDLAVQRPSELQKSLAQSRAARSSVNGSTQSKAGTTLSPSQAMRRA
jgi:hypothetical protein